MKDPDVLDDSINDAVLESMEDVAEDEVDLLKEHRAEKIKSLCSKWFQYGEYITVEIDTESETCIVVPYE